MTNDAMINDQSNPNVQCPIRRPSTISSFSIALVAIGHCLFFQIEAAPSQVDLFTNGPVLQLSIAIPPDGLESLRKEPRRVVPVTVQEGGQSYTNVALHLKGALGSFRSIDDKPGLILNFGKLASGQRFHGLKQLMLNNSVQDPSYLNECLAGQLFRQAGVPAPRTSHALVEMNGRKLGLYVLKEGFGKDFLRLYFNNTNGNFYDINQGYYDLGTTNELTARFRLDSGQGPSRASDLAALLNACQEKDPVQCWTKLQAVLDIDRFISFMAMETITCHTDGYSLYGHNFRIYHDPDSDKMVFIPNDLDRMFLKTELPVLRAGFRAQAAQAIMRTPEGQRQYRERASFLCTNVFRLEELTNYVATLSTRLGPAWASCQTQGTRDFESRAKTVCQRLVQRAAYLEKELVPSLPAQ